jgi:hypothetical protein
MSRCSVVLLTPPHSILNSSLFLALSLEGCTFCTALQKSGAHPLTFQSLAHSLQKRRVSPTAFFKFRRSCSLHGSRNTLHGSRLAKSFIRNTYSRSPRRVLGFVLANPESTMAVFWPESSARKSSRCNTYRLRAGNPFIRNTYKTPGGGGPMLAEHPMKHANPEELKWARKDLFENLAQPRVLPAGEPSCDSADRVRRERQNQSVALTLWPSFAILIRPDETFAYRAWRRLGYS